MKDYPIIFSAPMIRALLDGRKTMTRRLLYAKRKARNGIVPASATFLRDHPPPIGKLGPEGFPTDIAVGEYYTLSNWQRVKPGDRLWVRETMVPGSCGFEYEAGTDDDHIDLSDLSDDQVEFWNKRAGDDPDNSPKVSPIHMPRWASRLTLIVTATKIERLQDISEEDAKAEGAFQRKDRLWTLTGDLAAGGKDGPQYAFRMFWSELHGNSSWDTNPEVIAVTFKPTRANIDAVEVLAA